MSELINLRPAIRSPETRTVISEMGYPQEIQDRKTSSILDEYESNPGQPLYGIRLHGKLAGLIGLRILSADEAEIRHIVVTKENRGKGIGRRLIAEIIPLLGVSQLSAETDSEAVAFYRKVGFQIISLGQIYPGTERFRCVLSSPTSVSIRAIRG